MYINFFPNSDKFLDKENGHPLQGDDFNDVIKWLGKGYYAVESPMMNEWRQIIENTEENTPEKISQSVSDLIKKGNGKTNMAVKDTDGNTPLHLSCRGRKISSGQGSA